MYSSLFWFLFRGSDPLSKFICLGERGKLIPNKGAPSVILYIIWFCSVDRILIFYGNSIIFSLFHFMSYFVFYLFHFSLVFSVFLLLYVVINLQSFFPFILLYYLPFSLAVVYQHLFQFSTIVSYSYSVLKKCWTCDNNNKGRQEQKTKHVVVLKALWL